MAGKHEIIHPLLLECDATGKVLWMSPYARETLGDLRHVSELLRLTPPSINDQVRPIQFWTVWAAGETVLVGARQAYPADEATAEVSRLESRLVQKFFRLLHQEQLLAVQARNRRRGGERATIRLIEWERQRLGREMHTGVGQMLAAIRLQVELIEATLPDPPPRIRRSMESILRLAEGALEQVRSVSQRLHPPEWQRLTLESAVQQLWDLSGIPDHFRAQLQVAPLAVEPVVEVKALIYRAMQEALSNLLRHSKATEVAASLKTVDDRVVLTVVDNGVGFDVDSLRTAPASVSAGIGIRSIREQVEGIGGKIDIESGPSGTTLVVSVAHEPQD
jgi:signal transduction histidine kinase